MEFDESNFKASNEYTSDDFGENLIDFRFIRIYNPNNSDCRVSNFEVKGFPFYCFAADDVHFVCDVDIIINDGSYNRLHDIVTYKKDLTSTVENIYPYWGA